MLASLEEAAKDEFVQLLAEAANGLPITGRRDESVLSLFASYGARYSQAKAIKIRNRKTGGFSLLDHCDHNL